MSWWQVVVKHSATYAIYPKSALEKASCHFLMTAIRKIALYMLDS